MDKLLLIPNVVCMGTMAPSGIFPDACHVIVESRWGQMRYFEAFLYFYVHIYVCLYVHVPGSHSDF